ncbi:hypothetical protein CWC39_03780, partial [Corynebacterium heidelbergense]
MIGPDAHLVENIAARLVRCRALAGGGPKDRPDGVVAVAPGWEESAGEIVSAAAGNQGGVLVYTPGEWPAGPGVHVCPVERDFLDEGDLEQLQGWVDELWVDRVAWQAGAARADVERAERVKIWVRLQAQRVASQIIGTPQLNTPTDDEPAPERQAAGWSAGDVSSHRGRGEGDADDG